MEDVLAKARAKVLQVGKRTDKFLEVQHDVFETAKVVTKVVYDCAKANEGKEEEIRGKLDTLPELVIQDFDHDQIWAGVEMQNKARMAIMESKVDRLVAMLQREQVGDLLTGAVTEKRGVKRSKTDDDEEEEDFGEDDDDDDDDADYHQSPAKKQPKVQFEGENSESDGDASDDEEASEEGEGESEDEDQEDADSILNDPDFQHMSDSDGDDLPLFEGADEDESDRSSEDEDDGEGAKKAAEVEAKTDSYMENAMKSLKKNSVRSQVEDNFFKLSEMEKFLDKEDANEERRRLRQEKGLEQESDDDDSGSIDYFEEGDEEDEEDAATYKDYFNTTGDDQQEEEEQEDEDDDDQSNDMAVEVPDKATKLLLDSSDDETAEKDLGEVKSTHEEAQLRLKKKIKQIEDDAVGEKPWQMQGEVAGPARPENSLLQEHLDYDNVAKHAPVITEEVSKRLEDIILQRIKDKAWDDVERKVKPKEDPYEYKKRLVLDQEKSKLSLAQIYEQEYLKQKSDANDASKVQGLHDDKTQDTPKEVEEIKKAMASLFAKLDTLTHFHYTPRSADAEIKIVKNMPSIAMEEVAPVSRSDASLLAPAEIDPESKSRGELLGNEERTDTDRKRERRRKKSKQKATRLRKEKLESESAPGKSDKSNKKLAEEISAAEKKGKLKTLKDKGKDKAVKSSSAFFSQLQQETMGAIDAKRATSKKMLSGKQLSSGASFKL